MNYCKGAITFGTPFQTFYIIQNYEEIAELLGRVRQKYGSNISSFFVTLHHKLFSFTSVTCVQNLLMTGQVEMMTPLGDGKRMTGQATGDNSYRSCLTIL